MIISLGYLIKFFWVYCIVQVTQFLLNGELYFTHQKITLLDLITYFNYNDSLLVLELNKLICNKNKWNSIVITDYDKIEIITIVGGG